MEIDTYTAIGLMSGTSLDGLDLACCRFNNNGSRWTFEIITSASIDYSEQWRGTLKEAISYSPEKLQELDIAYGKWLGERARDFIIRHNLKVDLVASHGHTVFHQPEKGITLQIGSGQEIANLTDKVVISDFRKMDVELGGQGAPLVPIGDEHLFGQYSACLNLGGIANISFAASGKRVAYDIGMANMLLNYLANQLAEPYDKYGQLARGGNIDEPLLEQLNGLAYYNLPYPKSLGYEWFLSDVQPFIDSSKLSVVDKLATAVEHEVKQIAKSFENVKLVGEVLVTGGGALNTYFIERLRHYAPPHLRITIPENKIINFKEALVFAFMGVLKLRDEVNCLMSVTGASQDSSGGVVFEPVGRFNR